MRVSWQRSVWANESNRWETLCICSSWAWKPDPSRRRQTSCLSGAASDRRFEVAGNTGRHAQEDDDAKGPLASSPGNMQFSGAGRRAGTWRSRVRAEHKLLDWLDCTHEVPFPPAYVLRARRMSPCPDLRATHSGSPEADARIVRLLGKGCGRDRERQTLYQRPLCRDKAGITSIFCSAMPGRACCWLRQGS